MCYESGIKIYPTVVSEQTALNIITNSIHYDFLIIKNIQGSVMKIIPSGEIPRNGKIYPQLKSGTYFVYLVKGGIQLYSEKILVK
ncbi:MAG: hypothetical protein SNJ71_02640 [Bacteroidales bacterium]